MCEISRLPIRLLALIPAFLYSFQAFSQLTPTGSAVSLGSNCFLMGDTVPTSLGTAWTSAVWNATMIDLNNGFDIRVSVSITAEGPDSIDAADGLAIVIQNTGLGALAANAGSTMGYANTEITPLPVPCTSGAYTGGINPSFALELDTYGNLGSCIGDVAYDHIALVEDGSFVTPFAGPLYAIPGVDIVTTAGPGNYKCRELRMTYEAVTDTVRVYYNGVLRGRVRYDLIANVFGGNPMVYWGFTAATGTFESHIVACVDFANAGADESICQFQQTTFGPSGGVSYNWSPATGLSCTSCANPVFTGAVLGNFGYQVTTTNFAGCTDTDSIYVNVITAPIVDAGPAPTPICPPDSVMLLGSVSGTHPYVWSPAAGLSSTTILNPIANPPSSQYYYLTATDTSAGGCTTVDSVFVTVNPFDSARIISVNPVLCAGDSIQINVNYSAGINSVLWTPSAGLSSATAFEPFVTSDTTITYYLLAENTTSSCSYRDTITVTVSGAQINGLIDTTMCQGDTICISYASLSGFTSNTIVEWTGPAGTISNDSVLNPCIYPVGNATYSAIVIDTVSGCRDTSQFFVLVTTPGSIQVTPTSATINPGQAVQLLATGGVSYTWTPATDISCTTCPNPLVYPSVSTTYVVTGVDSAGCLRTLSVVITTDSFLVPNVFTPNGDNINDLLVLNYYGPGIQYEVSIFDRWGNQLFYTKDPNVFWNGKNSSGNDVPVGVYYLAVRILSDLAIPEADKQRVFHVTLMR